LPAGIEGTVVDCNIFSARDKRRTNAPRPSKGADFAVAAHLQDEIRILTDETLPSAQPAAGSKEYRPTCTTKTNKRLVAKGTNLTRDLIEKIRSARF